jgi:hypothetical protein
LVYINKADIRVGEQSGAIRPRPELVSVPVVAPITEIKLRESITPTSLSGTERRECMSNLDSVIQVVQLTETPKLDLSSLFMCVKLVSDPKLNKRTASAKK